MEQRAVEQREEESQPVDLKGSYLESQELFSALNSCVSSEQQQAHVCPSLS